MSETKITQDTNLDVEALFRNATTTKSETPSDQEELRQVVKTPLQQMQEARGKGLIIQNNDDDGGKNGGSMTDEREEAVNETLREMDVMIEKAKMVSVTEVPKSDIEMAELMHKLDELDIDQIKDANKVSSGAVHKVDEDEVLGSDITPDTVVANGDGTIGDGGLFRAKSETSQFNSPIERSIKNPESTVAPETEVSETKVVIDKTGIKPDTTTIIDFTEEEREKLSKSNSIELVFLNKINVDTGRVRRPDENFMKTYTTNMHQNIGEAATMTFVASRFRAKIRGLTFGEFTNLTLSSEITDVDTLNRKLSVIYNAIVESSIGLFPTYDDFLRNFSIRDLDLATYGIYIATNPETLEINLSCGAEGCKKTFTKSFSPRNLLLIKDLSPRFLEIMETTGSLSGEKAMEYHNKSSIIEKQIIKLPGSGVAIEVGLRSAFETIHYVLPYINNLETLMAEKYKNDDVRCRAAISMATHYVSAVYFQENGEYTLRNDNIEDICDIIYNLPMIDYDIIYNIMRQTEEDYFYQFALENVVCPHCKTHTERVAIDIDEEVFQRYQEQGNTVIDPDSLPRL